MKLYILTILLIISNISVAQLTVRNSTYIFANNEVIFVEDDVNLLEAESRLYLRNESQLIQGVGTSGNSGIGELSVRQNGTVNEYAYNYWCSPIGNVDSDDDINRSFRVNLIDDATGLITSSDALFTTSFDGSVSPLTIASSWLWTFEPGTEYSDWNFAGNTGVINPGLGFTMKGTNGSSENQLYEFRGKANNGTISNTVLNGEWTLVGNPYPSALDAFDFIHDTQNSSSISGELYYWEQAPGASSHNVADYVGGYAIYTISNPGAVDSFTPAPFTTYLADGTPTNLPAGSGTKIARRYIPIGQGFMVEGVTSSSVYVKNSHREFYKESETDSFFFGANTTSQNDTDEITTNETQFNEDNLNVVPEDFKRFRINIDFNNTYTRQLLMNFHHTATQGFDYGLEGKNPEVLDSDAYWAINNIPYCIQALKFNQELKIPLAIKINETQPISFRIYDVQRFNDIESIYLHDKENDIYVNLLEQNYALHLPVGNYTERFEITFTSGETLSVNQPIANRIDIFQDNELSQFVIENTALLDIKEVRLYNVLGKLVFNAKKLSQKAQYNFSTNSLNDGIYIVSVLLKDQRITKKKIIIYNN